jgi:hypothetical protein
MIDNFVLIIVFQWENCIELRFMQGEAPPNVALPAFVGLKNHFLDCWVGH